MKEPGDVRWLPFSHFYVFFHPEIINMTRKLYNIHNRMLVILFSKAKKKKLIQIFNTFHFYHTNSNNNVKIQYSIGQMIHY